LSLDLADFQYLATGESAEVSFTFDVTDGDASTPNIITLTIIGENDDPTLAGALDETATEDDEGFTLDLLSGAEDVDASDVLTILNISVSGGDASGITVDGDSLIVDPAAYNYLALGESVSLAYSYDIIDGNGGSVSQIATITITGQNDVPVVEAAIESTASEDDASFSVTSRSARRW